MQNSNHQLMKSSLDKPTFWVSALLLLGISAILFAFPEQSNVGLQKLFYGIVNYFGFVYTWLGMLIVGMCVYFAFSKYGKIKFGDPMEKPEFSTFTWASTLFTAGAAAALLFWGAIEWAYYYKAPPLGLEAGSWEAAEFAGTYGMFHWGITVWAIYTICALPVGYSYFVRKKPVLKVSEICRTILGDYVDGSCGKIIDIFFNISLIFGAATSLCIGVPVVSGAVCYLLKIDETPLVNIVILIITTMLFGITGFLGLKKGIAKLSKINSIMAFVILLLVFIFGPTLFIIKMATTSIGLLGSNFLRMSSWMDPINNGGFPESWTQFYWAWFLAYSPFMGLFIARISKGRTIKNVLLGSIGFGSLGCSFFFWVLGNYQMHLQLTGVLDIIKLVDEKSPSYAIMAGFSELPVGYIVILLYAICGTIFLATTFNSVSFSLAAVSTKEIKQDQDPNRYLVLFWSIVLALVPAGIFAFSGSISTLKSVTVIGSVPVISVVFLEMLSFVKMVEKDKKIKEDNCACEQA